MSVGGAAGNRGYLFQQRVSAAFLLVELLESPLSLLLGEEFNFRATTFLFEGNAEIDDLQIKFDGGDIYANIKSNLRFSILDGSALRSIFDQFVRQSRLGSGSFLIICDDRSSNQIRALGEILDRIKLANYESLPSCLLDADDRRIYEQLVGLMKELSIEAAKDAFAFLKRVSVVRLSFDFNLSLVDALKMLAVSKGFLSADLLWDKLALDCFTFAKARQLIDAQYLKNRYSKFKSSDTSETESEMFSDIRIEEDDIDWVKELLLVEWNKGLDEDTGKATVLDQASNKYALLEIYRFDDKGDRRLKFENGIVTLLNGMKLKLLARMAAYSTLERLVKLGFINIADGELVVMSASVDWSELKQAQHAKIHASRARLAFESRKSPDLCIECRKPLFSDRIQIVEIDEAGRDYQCGPVHINCLAPSHRVVGDIQVPAAAKFKWLQNFDINKWIRSLKFGPAGYQPFDEVDVVVATMFWNWTNVVKAKGDYCAKMIGEDEGGQFEQQYVTERGQIVLRNERDELAAVEEMRSAIDKARELGDPWMFELGGVFTLKSQFSKLNREVGPIFEVKEIIVEKFNRKKLEERAEKLQWYAPICVLRGASGKLFLHHDAVILVRDPFDFGKLASQFRLAGMKSKLEGVWLDIIESDFEFDALVGACFQLELGIVVDPIVDSNGNFKGGIEINPMPIDENRRLALIDS